MSDQLDKKIEIDDLPWYYKAIMKIPSANILVDVSSGIFWGLFVPAFFTLYGFLNLFLLLSFSFPVNAILAAMIPTVTLIMFVRISLERFIIWWNTTVAKSGFEWNVDKSVEEYLAKIKKSES